MFTIELYLKYLRNSILGKSKEERTSRLMAEKAKITKILESVDNCFYGDCSLLDKSDESIYTYIKKDIVKHIWANTSRIGEVIYESKFYLNSLLSEIALLDASHVA